MQLALVTLSNSVMVYSSLRSTALSRIPTGIIQPLFSMQQVTTVETPSFWLMPWLQIPVPYFFTHTLSYLPQTQYRRRSESEHCGVSDQFAGYLRSRT